MRLIVVALFALVLIFQIFQLTSGCKCCGCGCGHCGGCGCGCGGGCGWCGGHGCGYCLPINHHIISSSSHCAPAAAAAPSVIGIPVLSGLGGTRSCGCRGRCTCGDWE
ncbi:hypothetical protein ONE63_008834 [Megalurothrips usitatus]|uniref:Chorion class high-cysteine HCB protein 13-like n=1 Tax=Megalurothrips usitatus TaxID=439358 RepID=A0AAV7XUE3_9NEOP|nr:hypothetical protein ONE63_008834 [Megalurothrips usitatus]